MSDTVFNPIVWLTNHIWSASNHLVTVTKRVRQDGDVGVSESARIQKLEMRDLLEALDAGIKDFTACRSDVLFLCVLYPLIGLFVAWMAFDSNLLPIIFPMLSGFALVGPVAAVGLYEMSRKREMGQETGWSDAFGVMRSASFGAVFVLGLVLFAVFLLWIWTAYGIFRFTVGPEAPVSLAGLLEDVLTTGSGWVMIIAGISIGFMFAMSVLAVSVTSFPMLLDRKTGLMEAVATSIRVTTENPQVIGAWGFIVAVSLFIGFIPAMLGLIVALPVLGHATWHLYRKAVVWDDAPV